MVKINWLLKKGAGRNKLLKDERAVWRDVLLKKNGCSESRRALKMPHDESNGEKKRIRKAPQ
jgi:hypothetical protein